MLRKNATLQLLKQGKPAIGTWLQLCSVHTARLLCSQGCFQWMLVDFEHTPVDYSVAANIFSTISDVSGGAVTPLARVSVASVEQIKQALDCGAQGIVAPMVNTAEEARNVVRFAKFPPQGERGGGGLAPHLGFGVSRPEYMAGANKEILVAIQVETRAGVENIDEILNVEGIDLIFIGPNDLHMSLGLPAKFWSVYPEFLAAVEKITSACKRKNIPYGTLCREAPFVKERLNEGFTFLGMGSDAHFMLTFAGMQYGELYKVTEPDETWCNMVNLDRLGDSVKGMPRKSFRYDPNSPEFDIDPFPTYKYMRENVPVYWWPEAQGWIVTRYDDVAMLVKDNRFSVEMRYWENSPPQQSDDQLTTHQLLAKYGLFWLPTADHSRVRRIAGPLFTPKAVEPLREMLQEVVDDVLSSASGKTDFDIASDFSARYPLQAITHVLGIPREKHQDFKLFGSAVIDAFYPGISPDALVEKMSFLPSGVAMLEELIEDRRKSPVDDFLSKLVHATDQGETLTQKELLSMVALMISAGCEPPRHLVSFAVLNLLRYPDQLEMLQQEPELIRNAVDEAGRFDSFGKLNLPRFPLEDVEIRGVKIKKGQQVFGVFASALRDSEVFENADRFDIRRDQSRSLLYGDGIHVCLGKPIARLMVEVAVSTLFRRFPHMKLRGSPVFTRDTFFRKMVSLPVTLQQNLVGAHAASQGQECPYRMPAQ